MLNWLILRIFSICSVLITVSFLCFALVYAQPGDPLQNHRDNPRFSHQNLMQLEHKMGLDLPFFQQYGHWLYLLSQGNGGYSINYQNDALQIIAERWWWTLGFTVLPWLIGWIIAVLLSIYLPKSLKTGFYFIFGILWSIPNFILAMLFIILLLQFNSSIIGNLQSNEYISSSWSFNKLIDLLKHLLIPWFILTIRHTSVLWPQIESILTTILQSDFLQTAYSKGLSRPQVFYRHAFPFILPTLISLASTSLPSLVNGMLALSIVFNLPTLGFLFYESILNKDYYLIMDLLFISTLTLQLGNLLSDLATYFLDPRVRYA